MERCLSKLGDVHRTLHFIHHDHDRSDDISTPNDIDADHHYLSDDVDPANVVVHIDGRRYHLAAVDNDDGAATFDDVHNGHNGHNGPGADQHDESDHVLVRRIDLDELARVIDDYRSDDDDNIGSLYDVVTAARALVVYARSADKQPADLRALRATAADVATSLRDAARAAGNFSAAMWAATGNRDSG